MERNINKFSQGQYDVLVIGGGINGAAVAHLAALNGLRVALLEKNDFASGTSSKSTKLIHGGLRYLENFDFSLVRESLKERAIQLKSAPHLVHPLRFIIPVYKGDKRPLWMMRVGVWLYDYLSRKYMIERHSVLTPEEVCAHVPGIEQQGLVGGVAYSDAQMNDARLCLENVLSAAQYGADVANYVEVKEVLQENGKAVGVRAIDHVSQEAFELRAKKIVCAVGPWTNIFIKRENRKSTPKVRTTKGVHIVVKGRLSEEAVLIPARNDQRVFFVIPWEKNSLIGTTDTDYRDHPDDVTVGQEDISYLLQETKRVFPNAQLSEDNIITSFAGLRPLVSDQGSPSKISRKHVIQISYSGVIYVMGGKYTTYRKIAEDVVSRLLKKELINTEKQFSVYGSGIIKENPQAVAQQFGVKAEIVRYLMDFYGIRYKDVLALIAADNSLQYPFCNCSDALRAQVIYAVKTEMALTKEDIIMRRLTMGYNECLSGLCEDEIEQMIADLNVSGL